MTRNNSNAPSQRFGAPCDYAHAPQPQTRAPAAAAHHVDTPLAQQRILRANAMPAPFAVAPQFQSSMDAVYAQIAASSITAVTRAGALSELPTRLAAQARAIVFPDFRAQALNATQIIVEDNLPSWAPGIRAAIAPRAQRIAAYVHRHLPYAAQPLVAESLEPEPTRLCPALRTFIGRVGTSGDGGGPPRGPRSAFGSGPPFDGPGMSGACIGPPPPDAPIYYSLWPLWVAGGVAVACIGIATVGIGLSLLLTGPVGTGLAIAGGALCATGIGLVGYGFYLKHKEDPATLIGRHFPQAPSARLEALLWATPVARRYPAVSSVSQVAWTQSLSEPVLRALLETLMRIDAPQALVARMTANDFSGRDGPFLRDLRYVEGQSVEAYLDYYLATRGAALDGAAGANLENVMNENLIRASKTAILAFLQAHGPALAPSPVWVQEQLTAIKRYMATRTEAEMPRDLRSRALAALERPRLPMDFNGPLQDDPHFALLNDGSVGLGTLLALIWKFGDDTEARDGVAAKNDADNLRYSACAQLADCIEADNHRVCGVGVAQRFISVVGGYSAAVPAEDPASAQPGDILSALAEAFSAEIAEPTAADFAAFRTSALEAADARWLPSRAEYRAAFEAQLDVYIQMTQDS